jgi:hypothetical protein
MDKEQEMYIIPTRMDEEEEDYEETICAVMPLEEALALLDSSDEEE